MFYQRRTNSGCVRNQGLYYFSHSYLQSDVPALAGGEKLQCVSDIDGNREQNDDSDGLYINRTVNCCIKVNQFFFSFKFFLPSSSSF